jgi:hypothetical protein
MRNCVESQHFFSHFDGEIRGSRQSLANCIQGCAHRSQIIDSLRLTAWRFGGHRPSKRSDRVIDPILTCVARALHPLGHDYVVSKANTALTLVAPGHFAFCA